MSDLPAEVSPQPAQQDLLVTSRETLISFAWAALEAFAHRHLWYLDSLATH